MISIRGSLGSSSILNTSLILYFASTFDLNYFGVNFLDFLIAKQIRFVNFNFKEIVIECILDILLLQLVLLSNLLQWNTLV